MTGRAATVVGLAIALAAPARGDGEGNGEIRGDAVVHLRGTREASLTSDWLVADEVGPYGGRVYAMEIDLAVSWSLRRGLALLAEADVLFPGDFFPSADPMRRFIVGVTLSIP